MMIAAHRNLCSTAKTGSARRHLAKNAQITVCNMIVITTETRSLSCPSAAAPFPSHFASLSRRKGCLLSSSACPSEWDSNSQIGTTHV